MNSQLSTQVDHHSESTHSYRLRLGNHYQILRDEEVYRPRPVRYKALSYLAGRVDLRPANHFRVHPPG